MRRILLSVALVGLAAASAPVAAGPEAGPGRRTVEIRIEYSRFAISELDVAPGETIRFVLRNTDPIPHEFIVGDQAVQDAHELGTEAYHPPRPGEVTLPAGETVTTTFTFGEQDLFFGCHLPGHWAYGMRGVANVA